MDVTHDSARKVEPTTAPAPVVEAPAPAGPVPVAVGSMVVGHAEDHAEKDADRRADSALGRLQGLEPDRHQHGPGCEHAVRRAAAPVGGAPEVGLEGGALGTDTSAAIAERRGRGRRLEEPVLRRMQTAFDTDLSAVRIHDDAAAATLNRQVSARAFTTGKDIFFGARQYAPDTTEGERVLAHELAHTLQPASPVRRTATEAKEVIPTGAVKDRVSAIDTPTAATESTRGAAEVEAAPDLDTTVADQLPAAYAAMPDLLRLTGPEVRRLAQDVSMTGPLMDVVKGAFEANWFKAKECLVFGKWPGAKPAFSHEAGLRLMKALTELRGNVHTEIKKEVPERVRKRIRTALEAAKAAEGAASEADKPRFADRVRQLEVDANLPADDLIFFIGSVGADSVTSDVDVSTAGSYTEWGVVAYNQYFREKLGVSYDAGTVFDLNVYAKDFIFKAKDTETVTRSAGSTKVTTDVVPGTENPAEEGKLSAEERKAQDDDQETWALTHVARFLDPTGWATHTATILLAIEDPDRRTQQRERFEEAWARASAFRDRLEATMEDLADVVEPGAASAWGQGDQQHHAEGALLMRAANQIYEAELLKLKAAREEIAVLRGKDLAADDPGRERLMALVAEIPKLVSQASLYANEVYGSGGATVHAVVGMQGRNKRLENGPSEKAKDDAAGTTLEHDVVVHIPVAQWFQTFNDNLGDVLKDFQHFGVKHGDHEPDYWYAAFKMGKYVDRMLDAIPHLSQGADAMVTPKQTAATLALPAYQALKKLAKQHVDKKAGVAKTDPKKLAKDDFFKEFGAAQVAEVRNQALALWAKVRGDVTSAPPKAPAGKAGSSGGGATKPGSGGSAAPGDDRAVLESLQGRVKKLAEAFSS